jgi:hypothetical protein
LRILFAIIVMLLFGLAWLAPKGASGGPPSGHPEAIITALYDDASSWRILRWGAPRAPFGSYPYDQGMMSSGLAHKWRVAETSAQARGVPTFPWDAVTMSPGTRIKSYELRFLDHSPRRVVVAATFTSGSTADGQKQTVQYEFTRRPKSKRWVLQDIRSTRNGEPWIFSRALADYPPPSNTH